VDRAELGALRDAIDTILNWPDSVRGQVAQWLQTDVSKPNRADPGRLSRSRSRSNRPPGFKPSVEELAGAAGATGGYAHDPEAGVVQWAKTTAVTSAVSMRLGRLPSAHRRAGRQRSLAARRGKPYDAAVALTAEEEPSRPSPSHARRG
jgi:hypothetical protein